VFQGQVRVPAYNPEKNCNDEIGANADLLDERVRVNGPVFRNWYEDIQFGSFGPEATCLSPISPTCPRPSCSAVRWR
jgi:hypothetical protein